MDNGWKKYARLNKKKMRQAEGKFLVEGLRLCREALNAAWPIETAFISDTFLQNEQWPVFEAAFERKNLRWQVLSGRQFNRLADTETPQGVLLVADMPSYSPAQVYTPETAFIVLLQGVRDPGNLGTIIRTADWFNANAVLLSDDCVDPFNPKVVRGTMGSIFHLPVYSVPDIPAEIISLKQRHFEIVGTAVDGDFCLHQTVFKPPLALILGSEAGGISTHLLPYIDRWIRIRGYGRAESLNVAIAGGILMHQIANQVFDANKTKG